VVRICAGPCFTRPGIVICTRAKCPPSDYTVFPDDGFLFRSLIKEEHANWPLHQILIVGVEGAGDGTRTRSTSFQAVSDDYKSFLLSTGCRRRCSLFQPVLAGCYHGPPTRRAADERRGIHRRPKRRTPTLLPGRTRRSPRAKSSPKSTRTSSAARKPAVPGSTA
jgi:hypothetical protein